MSKTQIIDTEFIMRVLSCTAFDMCGSLFWRVDGEYAPLTIWVMCYDFFCWGTSDTEEITPENIHLLEQSIKDIKALKAHEYLGPLLFCARSRKMRPQGAYYSQFNTEVWSLLDECGPEREIGFGNPKPRPSTPTSEPLSGEDSLKP